MKEGFLGDFLLPIVKAILFAVCLTLACVLVFALVVKLTDFSSVGVKIVNQFIKSVSIITACILCVKEGIGYLKGAVIGLLYCIIISLIFSLIGTGNFILKPLEIILSTVVGIIGGILAINLKK